MGRKERGKEEERKEQWRKKTFSSTKSSCYFKEYSYSTWLISILIWQIILNFFHFYWNTINMYKIVNKD